MHETPALPKESNAKAVSPEFRERIVALARSGRSVSGLSADYGVAGATICRWLDQDRIDHGEKPGTTSAQNTELASARKRIRKLERELDCLSSFAATLPRKSVFI
jgi:transposase-like protein